MNKEIAFVKSILPEHYTVEESKSKGSIHCVSKIGIRKGIDAEDDDHWSVIMQAIKRTFGERFKEVYHNVCFCHTDFTIYLTDRKETEAKLTFEDYLKFPEVRN